MGVLYVDSRQAALRDVDDIEGTLVAVGRLVGAAVENGRLWEEVALRNMLLAHTVDSFAQPVSAIQLNAAEILQPGTTAIETVEAAVDIAAAAIRMNDLIVTTLEIARSASGRPTEAPPPVDLAAVVSRHLAALNEVQRSARIQLRMDVEPNLPRVSCPQERLRTVFTHLVFFGVRHAPPESVLTVSLRRRADAGPGRAARPTYSAYLFRRGLNLVAAPRTDWIEVEVHVVDYLLSAPAIEALLEPWPEGRIPGPERFHPGAPGFGLGLTLVEQCVRSMGGGLWIESVPGHGTSLSFSLPVLAVPV